MSEAQARVYLPISGGQEPVIDDLEQKIGAVFEARAEAPDGSEAAPVEVPPVVVDPVTEPPTDPAPPPAAEFEFEGRKVPAEVIRESLQFVDWYADWSQRDPEAARLWALAAQGGARVVPLEQPPVDAPPTIPQLTDDELDGLPEAVKTRLQAIDEMQSRFAQIDSDKMELQRQSYKHMIGQATETFARQYELAPEDIDYLQQQVVQTGILPGMVQFSGGDLMAGTMKALTSTYLSDPRYKEREMDRVMKIHNDALSRQRKASKLSGSSGAVSRQTSPPQNAQERRAAMVADLTRLMREGV